MRVACPIAFQQRQRLDGRSGGQRGTRAVDQGDLVASSPVPEDGAAAGGASGASAIAGAAIAGAVGVGALSTTGSSKSTGGAEGVGRVSSKTRPTAPPTPSADNPAIRSADRPPFPPPSARERLRLR